MTRPKPYYTTTGLTPICPKQIACDGQNLVGVSRERGYCGKCNEAMKKKEQPPKRLKGEAMTTRRLPDGSTTTSTTAYLDAWHALSKPLEDTFGWELHSFDPGLSLVVRVLGREVMFALPAVVAQAIGDVLWLREDAGRERDEAKAEVERLRGQVAELASDRNELLDELHRVRVLADLMADSVGYNGEHGQWEDVKAQIRSPWTKIAGMRAKERAKAQEMK